MVLANDILSSIAADIARITQQITQAKDLISAMREAGEPTSDMETQLFQLEVRKTKWENMLRARGYSL